MTLGNVLHPQTVWRPRVRTSFLDEVAISIWLTRSGYRERVEREGRSIEVTGGFPIHTLNGKQIDKLLNHWRPYRPYNYSGTTRCIYSTQRFQPDGERKFEAWLGAQHKNPRSQAGIGVYEEIFSRVVLLPTAYDILTEMGIRFPLGTAYAEFFNFDRFGFGIIEVTEQHFPFMRNRSLGFPVGLVEHPIIQGVGEWRYWSSWKAFAQHRLRGCIDEGI